MDRSSQAPFFFISMVVSHHFLDTKRDLQRIGLKFGTRHVMNLGQEALPLRVHPGHSTQIYCQLLGVEGGSQRVPCSFELGHPRSGNTSLEFQGQLLWLFINCDSQHADRYGNYGAKVTILTYAARS